MIVTALLNVFDPLTVCVPSAIIKEELVPTSGIVYVLDAAGAVELMVSVLVVPNTI